MQSETGQKLSIRVAGIGGAGAKIVSALCAKGCEGADMAAVDTDESSLRDCPVENAVCIGKSVAGGMGSGGIPPQQRRPQYPTLPSSNGSPPERTYSSASRGSAGVPAAW